MFAARTPVRRSAPAMNDHTQHQSLVAVQTDGPHTLLPTWLIDDGVLAAMPASALAVLVPICVARGPDGRSYITPERLREQSGLGRSAVLKGMKWLREHPRRMLVEHATGIYTVFPDDTRPGEDQKWVPPERAKLQAGVPNERTIQLAIMRETRSSLLTAAPNYTPVGWWECDVWGVTKARYVVEYEIKLSVNDFRNDAEKARERWTREDGWMTDTTKHAALASGDRRGPSRFFYVVPSELQSKIEPRLPAWSGLGLFDGRRVFFVKEAPKLHTHKVRIREVRLAQNRMWYRYWESLADLDRIRLRGGA